MSGNLVLVTGATGFTGRAAIETALSLGLRVWPRLLRTIATACLRAPTM